MPIDRSRIKKGMMLYSDEPLPGYTPPCRKAHDNLSLATEKLKTLDSERAQLAVKLAELRRQVDAITSKGRR